jgi:hypothetical protein
MERLLTETFNELLQPLRKFLFCEKSLRRHGKNNDRKGKRYK